MHYLVSTALLSAYLLKILYSRHHIALMRTYHESQGRPIYRVREVAEFGVESD